MSKQKQSKVIQALEKRGKLEKVLEGLAQRMAAGPSAFVKQMAEAMVRFGFHGYSPANTLMILAQYPEATLLKGVRGWNRLGRRVKKGEKGIAILAPILVKETRVDEETGEEKRVDRLAGFKVVHVFDYKQTEGEPIELPEAMPVGGQSQISLEAALQRLAAKGIPVEIDEDPSPVRYGHTDGKKIVIARREEGPMLATLLHELAHYKLHYDKEGKPLLPGKRQAELEAELTGLLAGQLLGLDFTQASSDYLLINGVEPREVLEVGPKAIKAAREIVELLGVRP